MSRRRSSSASLQLARAYQRQVAALTRATLRGSRSLGASVQRVAEQALRPPPGPGEWLRGLAFGPAGARRFFVHRPPDLPAGRAARLPLLVMLHGCGQNARDFAIATRMNRLARREGFLVLYPEQDRLANAQGCWNWFEGRSGRARAEASTLLAAIDQTCLLYGADPARVAIAGLSAGASMAAFMAHAWPQRFAAVAMHSGVGPGTAVSSATALQAMQGRRRPQLRVEVGAGVLPPLLVLQGDADGVVNVRNAGAVAGAWAEACGASAGAAQRRQRGQRRPAIWQDYHSGPVLQVRCVIVQGLGHAWSGGAARGSYTDPQGPDASALVWGFAARAFTQAADTTAR